MAKDFAIIKIQGKQHLVSNGDEILVDRMDAKAKTKLDHKDVLLLQTSKETKVGTPLVEGAKIELQVLEHTRGEKVRKQTYKAKARQRRHVGHRQELTKLKVTKLA